MGRAATEHAHPSVLRARMTTSAGRNSAQIALNAELTAIASVVIHRAPVCVAAATNASSNTKTVATTIRNAAAIAPTAIESSSSMTMKSKAPATTGSAITATPTGAANCPVVSSAAWSMGLLPALPVVPMDLCVVKTQTAISPAKQAHARFSVTRQIPAQDRARFAPTTSAGSVITSDPRSAATVSA